MTFLGAVDIPNRGLDDFRATLRDRESKLAAAKKQRDIILADIRKASERVDMGNQAARFELVALNKSNVAAGRLILSLEADVAQSRKRVELAEAQEAAVALKRGQADAAAVPGDKWFECICPDGVRRVRHRAASLEALQRVLQPGYVAVGQVFGHAEDGTGGFVSTPGAPSMMKALLESNGDELITFLAAHGIVGGDKQPVVVALPSNNREPVQ
jgi:hypothetical protein